MRAWIVAGTLAASAFVPTGASAEEAPQAGSPAGDAERRRLEEQIAKELGSAAAPQGGSATSAPPPAAAPAGGQVGSGALARLLLLPDLSAIGSFAGVYDSYDAAGRSPRSGATGPADKPTFLFQELELGLQAVVDPYVRADVFTSFTPGEVSVEEAYLTTLALPAGFQVRAGRFFSPVGRINPTHPHTWDFLDAPLAHDRLVAGDTLAGPGVEASWLAPLPWFAELQLAAQSTAPYAGEQERFTAVARLSQFLALSEALTVGVGLSAVRRDEPGAGDYRDVGAADLLVKYRPISGRAWVTLQAEAFERRFRGPGPAADGGDGWGAYAQLFWRQGAWSGYGVRWDRAPGEAGGAGAPFAGGAEQRWSAVADWFVTEFQRYGLQVAVDDRPGAAAGWEVLVHGEFIMGAHGAHPF